MKLFQTVAVFSFGRSMHAAAPDRSLSGRRDPHSLDLRCHAETRHLQREIRRQRRRCRAGDLEAHAFLADIHDLRRHAVDRRVQVRDELARRSPRGTAFGQRQRDRRAGMHRASPADRSMSHRAALLRSPLPDCRPGGAAGSRRALLATRGSSAFGTSSTSAISASIGRNVRSRPISSIDNIGIGSYPARPSHSRNAARSPGIGHATPILIGLEAGIATTAVQGDCHGKSADL